MWLSGKLNRLLLPYFKMLLLRSKRITYFGEMLYVFFYLDLGTVLTNKFKRMFLRAFTNMYFRLFPQTIYLKVLLGRKNCICLSWKFQSHRKCLSLSSPTHRMCSLNRTQKSKSRTPLQNLRCLPLALTRVRRYRSARIGNFLASTHYGMPKDIYMRSDDELFPDPRFWKIVN